MLFQLILRWIFDLESYGIQDKNLIYMVNSHLPDFVDDDK